ncbi:MAG: AAA family ATPase [Bacteroidales bacterium]|nr:AAA family ATPase [Bacteroidales bacterium]
MQNYTIDDLVKFYRDLAVELSTPGASIFMVTYGSRVKELNLAGSDIINAAKKRFPSDEVKFRPQELGHAYKMYDYFVEHPEMMHLPGIPLTTSPSTIIKSITFSGQTHTPFLQALHTKPFLLLAGISGTGKSRWVREMAFSTCPSYLRQDPTVPGNYCMIEVKPNWHDSSELLGYYSNISQKYNYTKFVQFLIKALQHPHVPFFVCLDEMNLAHVEEYFAEFLSVLETRKWTGEDHGRKVVTGALVDKQYFQEIYTIKDGKKCVENPNPSDRDWYEHFFAGIVDNADNTDHTHTPTAEDNASHSLREKGLTLPDNVFVVGTVNMDETTKKFSRKVIDRAFTIEMNGGKLEDMFGGAKRLDYPTQPDNELMTADQLKPRYVTADEVLEQCPRVKGNADAAAFITGRDSAGEEVADSLPKKLYAINEALKGTPFEVSYRVLNELVVYLATLLDQDTAEEKTLQEWADTALADIALMKVLPRIEGDEDLLCPKGDNKLEKLRKALPGADDSALKIKLQEMTDRLSGTGFTRFWS